MNKTIFILSTILVIGFSSLAQAQPLTKALPRIGFIYSTGAPGAPSLHSILLESFQAGLFKLGYEEGKNFLLERR
jgi:hypothetical protein